MLKPKIIFIGKYKIDGVEDYGTIQDCYEYIKDKKFLGIDIETTRKFPERKERKSDVYKGGLDPYLTEIVMLQIGNYEKIFVIDGRDFSKEELRPITDFLNLNKGVTFIGVNLRFEAKHLKHNYGINFSKIFDCMIVEMCLFNGLSRSFSLAGMAGNYLGVPQTSDINLFNDSVEITMDDELLSMNEHLITPFEVAELDQIDKSTRMGFVTLGKKPFTAKQVLYGADDILYPLLIAERQMLGRKLDNGEIYCPKKLFKLENQMVLVLADIELNGMPFDSEKWVEIAIEKEKEYAERLEILNTYVEQHYPKFVEEPNLFDFHRRCKIEWGSSQQVVNFFRHLEICPQEFSKQTKKLDWTVGAVALLKTIPNDYKDAYANQQWIDFDVDSDGKYVIDNDKLILAYLLLKRSEQAITTFGRDWLKYVHPITGRVHCNFRQILNSGRMSSSRPNLQQCPAGVYRDPFRVEKGYIVASDFANQEMRTAACLANEAIMIQVFSEGHPVYNDDLHMATADSMNKALNPNADYLPKKGDEGFTKEIKKQRDRAKIVNFGILYGKEAKGFAEDFGMSFEEAEDFIKNYFKAYPGLKTLMDRQAKDTFKNNCITINPMTGRRWFSALFDEMYSYRDSAKEYFPDEYFNGKMPKEEKEKYKARIDMEYPEVKQYWRNFFGIRGSIQRKSTNFLVQGTSSDETKTALVMLRKRILEENLPVLIINSVHDELLIEVTDDNREVAEKCAAVLKQCMEDGANLYLDPPIMKSEPEIDKFWVH